MHSFFYLIPALLLLGGCTLIPNYQRPAAPVAGHFPGGGGKGEAAAADLAWRDFFAEPRLKKLIGLALENNRDLRVAMLNVEQARAQYRIERAALYPTLNGGGSFSRQHAEAAVPGSRNTDAYSATVGSTAYELDLFGRVRSLSRQALERYFATEEGRRNAQLTLVAQVGSQYFTLRQVEEQLALARRTLAVVEDSFKVSKSTFDAGASNELDLRTAEAQVQTAKINILTYERQVAQAQNALVLLIGRPLPGNLPEARPFDGTRLLAAVPAGLPSGLLERRPDILQAEHTLKAANANIGAARAAFFPSISLTASAGSNSAALSKLFGGSSGVWNFGPQLNLPIFTGGRNQAELDVAKVETRIEVANYEKSIQTAFREVADALVGRRSYAAQIAEQQALISAQQRRFDLSTARYRQGEDTYLNVLSSQQDLYSAQQNLILTRFDSLDSQINLYKALGGGWK
ncbi:MAG: multidrug transporter [Verrucomicrobiaceae bacterium]|nr:multidrug transporter [Verrucomicrobiaceae bacterium]